MKRQGRQALLGICVMGMLALAGCGGQSPADSSGQELAADALVQQTKDTLEHTDSYMAHFLATVKMADVEETTTEAAVCFVEEPLYMQVDAMISMDGATQGSTTYLAENGDKVDLYMNYNQQWTEMTMDREAAMKNLQIYHTLDNMAILLDAGQGWELTQDGDGLELTATIPESDFYTVEERARLFQLAGLSGLSEDYFHDLGDVSLRVTLDQKTQKPLSYEIDLTKALEAVTNNVLLELNGGTLENGVNVESYVLSSSFSKLGNVGPKEIPQEARSSAVNYEEEFTLMVGK